MLLICRRTRKIIIIVRMHPHISAIFRLLPSSFLILPIQTISSFPLNATSGQFVMSFYALTSWLLHNIHLKQLLDWWPNKTSVQKHMWYSTECCVIQTSIEHHRWLVPLSCIESPSLYSFILSVYLFFNITNSKDGLSD